MVDASRRTMHLQPDRASVYTRYAEALLWIEKKYDEAELMCRRGLELNPNHGKGNQILREALISENRLTEGLTYLRRSLEINPNNAAAADRSADALLMLDLFEARAGRPPATTARLDRAVRLYRLSVRVRPDGPHALMRLAYIMASIPTRSREDRRRPSWGARPLHSSPRSWASHTHLRDSSIRRSLPLTNPWLDWTSRMRIAKW